MKPMLKLAKNRASKRGAALVETAFMAPLWVIIIFSGYFAYNFGRAQIDQKTKARMEAWETAMANCGSAGQSETEKLPSAVGAGTPITHDTTNANLGTQMQGTLSGHGGGSFIVTIVQGLVNVIAPLFPNPKGASQDENKILNFRIPNVYTHSPGAGTKNVKENVTLFCNEAPTNGDLPILDAVAAAADAIVIAMAPSP